MIADLSPLVRRLLAATILLLAIAGAIGLVIVPLATLAVSTHDALADSRFRKDRLERLAEQPEPRGGATVPQGLLIEAVNSDQAMALFSARINMVAAARQLAVERIVPQPTATPGRLELSVLLSGPPESVLALVTDLERGPPAIRMTRWSIARSEPVATPRRVVLDATLVAVTAP